MSETNELTPINKNVTSNPYKRHLFTYQLFEEQFYNKEKLLYLTNTLEEKLKQIASIYSYQLELGEKTNRYHFQGACVLTDRKRADWFKNKTQIQIVNWYYKGEFIGNNFTPRPLYFNDQLKKVEEKEIQAKRQQFEDLLKEHKFENSTLRKQGVEEKDLPLQKEIETFRCGHTEKLVGSKGYDYCSKEETAVEPETFRREQGSKSDKDRYLKSTDMKPESKNSKWEFFVTCAKNGWTIEQMEEYDPAFVARNRLTLEKEIQIYNERQNRIIFPTNYNPFMVTFYLTGESGTGKNKMLDLLNYELFQSDGLYYVTDYKGDPFDSLEDKHQMLVLNEYDSHFNKSFILEILDKRINIRLKSRYYNKPIRSMFKFMTNTKPFKLLHNANRNKIDNIRELHRRVDFVINLTKQNRKETRQKILKIMKDKLEDLEKFKKMPIEEKIAFLEDLDNGNQEPVFIGFEDIPETKQVEMVSVAELQPIEDNTLPF